MRTLFYIFLLVSNITLAKEQSQSFQIRVYDRRVHVVSPGKVDSKAGVNIENNTLSNLIGEIRQIDSNGHKVVLKRVSIKSQHSVGFEVPMSKEDKVFFIPMAPPSQDIQLIAGKRAYEIPPKK